MPERSRLALEAAIEMAKAIHLSRSGHIGDHVVVEDLGRISVRHPDAKHGRGGVLGVLDSIGLTEPECWSEAEAREELKEKARRKGADGVINVSTSELYNETIEAIEGVAVRLTPKRAARGGVKEPAKAAPTKPRRKATRKKRAARK